MKHSGKDQSTHPAFWHYQFRQRGRIWLLFLLIVLSGEWTMAQQKTGARPVKEIIGRRINEY